jgi:hypothetical protein
MGANCTEIERGLITKREALEVKSRILVHQGRLPDPAQIKKD